MAGYTSWVISKKDRKMLRIILKEDELDTFVGHHITYEYPSEDGCIFSPKKAHIIGKVCAEDMVILLVSIDGNTVRPDGQTYHITWSYTKTSGKKSVDSNDVLSRNTIEPLDDITHTYELTDLIPSFTNI